MASTRPLVIYAPGAGSSLADPFGAFLSRRLAESDVRCWRFQFPYMEAKRRAPDRTPTLEATWRAVIAQARRDAQLVVGGRSMGGRIASQVVAQGADVAGLALFAYPLHPPGRPADLRIDHLSSIRAPTLFCSGTRDAFASPEELAQAAAFIPASRLHLLEAADHGFNVPRTNGRTREDVLAESVKALLSFIQTL